MEEQKTTMEIRSRTQPSVLFYTIGINKEGREIKLFRNNNIHKWSG